VDGHSECLANLGQGMVVKIHISCRCLSQQLTQEISKGSNHVTIPLGASPVIEGEAILKEERAEVRQASATHSNAPEHNVEGRNPPGDDKAGRAGHLRDRDFGLAFLVP